MARFAIKRLLLLGKVLGVVRGVVERDAGPPLIRPVAELGMVRREAFITLLMTRLTCPVIHCREVELRALMLSMARRTRQIVSRRRYPAFYTRDFAQLFWRDVMRGHRELL